MYLPKYFYEDIEQEAVKINGKIAKTSCDVQTVSIDCIGSNIGSKETGSNICSKETGSNINLCILSFIWVIVHRVE